MTKYKREITKEQYDRAMENRGYITSQDEADIFSMAELCGYGVYSAMADMVDGKYYVKFYLGGSCD
jgi:hypothetical protein